MGKIWMPGGGGGIDLDVITAAAWDVLKGKVIVDKDGNPLTGTLELTGNAGTGDVLVGKTFYNNNAKSKQTGTMPNQGTKNASLNCGASYTIPAGYHNGSGKITANSLSSQTSGTATAAYIRKGYTAWVNGTKITGNIPSKGAQTYTPGRSNQTIASGRYLSGTQTILGDSNLVSSNIVDGVSIFGVQGNADGYVCPSGYVYRNGNNKANFALETSFGDASRGGISNEPGGAYLKTDSGSFVHTWTSGQRIDLTSVSTVRLTLRQINGVAEDFRIYLRYGYDKSSDEEGNINVSANTSFSEFNVDFDVSGVSGSKYIGFYFSMLGNNTVLAVHSVRLI